MKKINFLNDGIMIADLIFKNKRNYYAFTGNFENNLAEAFNLMNTGKIDKAINLFENLTEKYPKTAKAFHLKAFAYTQDKNFNKALESIEKAKNLSPDNLDINLDYANILSAINKKKEAINILSSIESKLIKMQEYIII